MNNKCSNCLNMFQTTQACLEANKPVYKNVPAVVTASEELDGLVAAILTAQCGQASADGVAGPHGSSGGKWPRILNAQWPRLGGKSMFRLATAKANKSRLRRQIGSIDY